MNHISHYRGALPHQIHPNHCPPLQNFPARFPSPTIPDNVNALMISQMANDGTLQYHNTNVQHFIVENRHMGQNTEPIKEPAQPTRKPERISTGFQTIETDANFKPSISSNTSQRLTHHCNRGAKNCAQCFKGQTKIMVDVSTMTDNDEMDQAASWASVTTQPGNTKVAEYLTSLRQFLKLSSPPEGKRRLGDVRIISSSDGTRLYCCPECHMAYPDKSLLEPHLAAHKIERRFICTVCGAGLKRKEHLDRHALSHSDERPYSCQLCPKTFKRNEHLARHAIVHTGHKGQIEKPWVCSTCGVGHARKEHLDRHLLCHTDERPFTCQVCAKSFKRHEHLLRHVIIHTGHKTEICPECGKGFYRKDHLRKHLQGHAAKKAKMAATAQNGGCSAANGGCSAANGGCSAANGGCSAANGGCSAANGGCSAANGGCSAANAGCSAANAGCSAANGGCSAVNGGCSAANQTIQHQTPVSVASQHHDANSLLPPLPSAPKFEAFSEYKGKL